MAFRTSVNAPLFALAASSLLTTPALAHHSFAMFDRTREIALEGTVREFQWTNPHSWIELDVRNDKGGTDLYNVEMNSPNNLIRQGWKSGSLKVGDKVTVTLNPTRDGAKGGLFVSVMFPDGRSLGDPTRRGAAASPKPSQNP